MAVIVVNGTGIQAAANAAATGDTLDVRGSGNYIGFQIPTGKKLNVFLDGGAKIVGPPTGSTTGNVVEIKGAGSHFRAADVSGAKGQHGSGVSILAPDVTVEKVAAHDSERGYGIRLYGSAAVRAKLLDVEAYHAAIGIFVDGGGADTLIANPVIHDIDRMLVNDPTPGNDTGGQAFGFKRNNGLVTVTNPTIDRSFSVKQPIDPGEPASNDYGWDGAHFELYESGPVLIEGGTVRGSPIVVETGKSSTGQECRDFTMKGTKVYGQWPGAIPADPNQAGLIRSNKGFLLRTAVNFTFEDLELHDLDYWIVSVLTGGTYGGTVSGLRVRDNKAWLKPGTRWVSWNAGVPFSAMAEMGGNNVYHSGQGSVVAEVAGKGTTNDRAVFQGWTGLEGSSYWGPEVAVDPCAALVEQVKSLTGQLVLAEAERDDLAVRFGKAQQNALETLAL